VVINPVMDTILISLLKLESGGWDVIDYLMDGTPETGVKISSFLVLTFAFEAPDSPESSGVIGLHVS